MLTEIAIVGKTAAHLPLPDLAHVHVRDWLRREIWSLLHQAGRSAHSTLRRCRHRRDPSPSSGLLTSKPPLLFVNGNRDSFNTLIVAYVACAGSPPVL
jgi:hypothetical protein